MGSTSKGDLLMLNWYNHRDMLTKWWRRHFDVGDPSLTVYLISSALDLEVKQAEAWSKLSRREELTSKKKGSGVD